MLLSFPKIYATPLCLRLKSVRQARRTKKIRDVSGSTYVLLILIFRSYNKKTHNPDLACDVLGGICFLMCCTRKQSNEAHGQK